MQDQERRASESNRTALETIVEIRGSGADVQPFEAEAVDVSGRGMHVRTAYLPPFGAPLVCRFHHNGREVLVEGVVAWRVERARGGDFGVQFTAIDKDGVDVLKDLCTEAPGQPDDGQNDAEELVGLGARVRLHIEGLNSPMKAAVRDGSSRKLRVGSNLEFLRVGRRLELEAQDSRVRHSARIDGVEVVIDPQTGVPQLMVTLRLREGERTPEPSVVDVGRKCRDVATARPRIDVPETERDAERFEQEVVEEGERLHRRLSEQVGAFAERAGSFLESSGGRLGSLGVRGMGRAGRLARRAIAAAESLATSRTQKAKGPQRVTAPAPHGGFGQPRSRTAEALRAQRPTAAPRSATPSARPGANARRSASTDLQQLAPKGRRLVALMVGAGAVALVLALVLRTGGGSAEAPSGEARAVSSPTGGAAAPAAGQATPAARLSNTPAAQARTTSGIVANVPLFGEIQMAPTEPVRPAVEAPANDEEDTAPAPPPKRAPDETWETAPAAKVVPNEVAPHTSGPSNGEPGAVAPWGRGSLHLPTVYELALNAPGAGLEGSVEATGFNVFVPDRTVSNDTLGISRRDPRIVKVVTENTKDGARIRFRFRDAVPAYKVRLRGDKIHFLISAPE